MNKIANYLKKDKNWVDMIWFTLFSITSIITPLILSKIGVALITTSTIISMISTPIGFLGALLLLQRNKWHVIAGLPGNALLGVVLWLNGIYAVAIINWTISPIVHLWGAWKWNKVSKKSTYIEARQMDLWKGLMLVIGLITIFGAIGSLLIFTPLPEVPIYVNLGDAATGTMYLAAMILGGLMFKEQYWAWLFINVLVVLYFIPMSMGIGMGGEFQMWTIPTLILFVGYFISSIWGQYKWRKIS